MAEKTPYKTYYKIDVLQNKKIGNFVLGQFKSAVNNSKTRFTVDYDEKVGVLNHSKVTGYIGEEKLFELTPYLTGDWRNCNLKIGSYEVNINLSYNGSGNIEDKLTRVINQMYDRIQKEYMFDENTHKYILMPKLPNFFQRTWQKIRGK